MRTVTLGVSSREEMSARFVAAFKGKRDAHADCFLVREDLQPRFYINQLIDF